MRELLNENKGIVAVVLLLGISGAVFASTQTDVLSSLTGDPDEPVEQGDAMKAQGDAMEAQGDAMESEGDSMDSEGSMENESMHSNDSMSSDEDMNDSMER